MVLGKQPFWPNSDECLVRMPPSRGALIIARSSCLISPRPPCYSFSFRQTPCTSFSTTACLDAADSRVSAGPPKKGTKTLKIKKSGAHVSGRAPPAGDRKASRNRIVLSNTNALEVRGLEDLNAKNMGRESSKCQMFGLSVQVVDSLRAVDAFKRTQGWHMFRKPSVLWRGQSIRMAQTMANLDRHRGSEARRLILVGEKGSGKSVLLLQATAMAFLKGWIVINLPDGMCSHL